MEELVDAGLQIRQVPLTWIVEDGMSYWWFAMLL